MENPSTLSPLFVFLVSLSSIMAASADNLEGFLQCLSTQFPDNDLNSSIYTPNNSSYTSILQFTIQNLRFTEPPTPKPLAIVTPFLESQIPPIIRCAKDNGIQIRTRSGGHDYEGLSYRALKNPFIILDLFKLREISINVEEKTAWVQTGATTGELYYAIANETKALGFPAVVCPTVGVGGHISAGGYGTLLRKYGMAADSVIDARIVDANGRILDRKSMGEDLFWAIRGGGGASFGVITEWKLQLVPVPEKVTAFTIKRNLEENATELVYKWQQIAHKFPKDLSIARIFLRAANSSKSGGKTIEAEFSALFLGEADGLMSIMQERFPELGVTREDCIEMSWIESIVYDLFKHTGESLEFLLNRDYQPKVHSKSKSDYVKKPIPVNGLESIWELLFQEEAANAAILMVGLGGIMDEIPESAIPYPHREGYIYLFEYIMNWNEEGAEAANKYMSWIRKLYQHMTKYVSSSPRATYLNYRDLDLGVNNDEDDNNSSYEKARVWGNMYFKNNFEKLVRVKRKVDPTNFFRHEQSVPVHSFSS